MSPYGPMFSGLIDNIVMFLVTASIVCIGTIYFPRNLFHNPAGAGSGEYFTAFAYTLLSLSAAIACIQVLGFMGFFLGVKSPLWFFWEPLYLLSTGMVFRHLPVLLLAVLVWAAFGWLRLGYSAQVFLLPILLSLTIALNIGFYFAIEAYTRS